MGSANTNRATMAASSAPPNTSTIFRHRCTYADPAAAVHVEPSTTIKSSGRRFTVAYRCLNQSLSHQQVVAIFPSSKSASARSTLPLQALVTRQERRASVWSLARVGPIRRKAAARSSEEVCQIGGAVDTADGTFRIHFLAPAGAASLRLVNARIYQLPRVASLESMTGEGRPYGNDRLPIQPWSETSANPPNSVPSVAAWWPSYLIRIVSKSRIVLEKKE